MISLSRRWLSPLPLLLLPTVAAAVNPAQWNIVEQINRTDTTKSWVSPTPIDLDKMAWQYVLEITKLTGTVSVPFIGEITQDITSQIPPEDRIVIGETRDLPAVIAQESFADANSGTSADVFVEVDNLGFGRAVFSNIVLGSVDVPVFGLRPIQRINFEASVTITGYDYGDFNRDALIDASDYVVWRKTLLQTGEDLIADGNNDQTVEMGDYDLWHTHFGDPSGPASAGAPVPEPTTPLLVFIVSMAAASRLRMRSRFTPTPCNNARA
jgi:hypothetical protein